MPTSALFDDYIATAERIGIRRKAEETTFGIKLARLVPGLGRSRPYIGEPGLAKRTWCYLLPSLEECREAFEQEVNQPVAWGDDDA